MGAAAANVTVELETKQAVVEATAAAVAWDEIVASLQREPKRPGFDDSH